MLIKFLLLISISWFTFCVHGKEPEINDKSVAFSNGITLQYTKKERFFADASVAQAKRLPVYITESPRIIYEWNIVALVTELHYFEGSVKKLSLYDYEGSLIVPVFEVVGDILYLSDKRKIILFGNSAHYDIDFSFVYSLDTMQIKRLEHGAAYRLEVSQDEELLWFYQYLIVEGSPVVNIKIFNSDGKSLKNINVRKKGSIDFNYNNKTYSIDVDTPKVPG